ncbi:hypothetical protein T484DRAFT_1747605 [Baffinella frigidus]|nr:hypothetical protein T484DRAFT_1747605 [Cryptophyta sp. CCMP2293]
MSCGNHPRIRCCTGRNPRGFTLRPRTGRGFCFCASSILASALLLWLFARGTDALADLTPTQCQLLLNEFRSTFIRNGDGYPTIESCDARVVRLMWTQLIQRVYSEPGGMPIKSYASLRNLSDTQFAKLVVNAAAGSLMDAVGHDSDDALIRIRVDSHGHFARYVLHNSNRITALQTMLVISIVTLAVTWWRIEKDKTE